MKKQTWNIFPYVVLLNKRIPAIFFLKKIQTEFFFITAYSVFITYVDQQFFFKSISIPLPLPTILGTAISLLLAFRTNQAYERWWEARIIWGAIVNDSRTLIRQIQTFYIGQDQSFISDFVSRQVAWCHALGRRLRGKPHLNYVKKYLKPEDIKRIEDDNNIPNSILALHGDALRQAFKDQALNDFQQIQVDKTITRLCDSMGRCERIKSTVFPRTYSILLHVLIYVFATLLPLGLTSLSMDLEIILNLTITLIFFLIERTAVYTQDPFENRPTDVAVTFIARIIERNLLQMTNDRDRIPKRIEDCGYYVM